MNETKSARSFDTGSVSGIVGYRLRRAQVSVFQQFMARFAELGLTPAEYSVLALVGAHPGSKQTQNREALGIKRANFVTLINALKERGLTYRRQRTSDRVAMRLFLTGAGETFLARPTPSRPNSSPKWWNTWAERRPQTTCPPAQTGGAGSRVNPLEGGNPSLGTGGNLFLGKLPDGANPNPVLPLLGEEPSFKNCCQTSMGV